MLARGSRERAPATEILAHGILREGGERRGEEGGRAQH